MKNFLAPSILAGNHANLSDALNIAESDGRKWIHLDIMDGHFVPNLSFGPQTVSDLRKKSELFFDVHLMLDNPDLYIDAFAEAGSDLITIHIEPNYNHIETVQRIQSLGKKVGIAINPSTPVSGIIELLEQVDVDLVLCMTVNPGFGGQSFIGDVLQKAKQLKQLRETSSKKFLIEVDGGVCPEHVKPCLDVGVNIFVAGTAYFRESSAGRSIFARSTGEEI
jgi:ribulose-phosphate 3-epimerase